MRFIFLKIFFYIIFIIPCKLVVCQNLIFNGGFEALNICTEYNQACSPAAWFNIHPTAPPIIYNFAVPKPLTGADLLILPIENLYKPITNRAYVYTVLACPLQKGKQYKIKFYLHTNGKKFFGIDFLFAQNEFFSNTLQPETLTPSLSVTDTNYVQNKKGWNYIEALYTANGAENYVLIGNLSKTPFAFIKDAKMNKAGDVFYFIDDISINPTLPQAICNTFNYTEEKILSQHLRHTERLAPTDDEKPVAYINDTITIPAVFFETDKAIIKNEFKKQLDKIILKFQKKNIVKIEVEGHTDNTGTQERNAVLSQDRANAVLSYFLVQLPNLVSNAYATGKADKYPIADNNTVVGKAKNRRVQIVISYLLAN